MLLIVPHELSEKWEALLENQRRTGCTASCGSGERTRASQRTCGLVVEGKEVEDSPKDQGNDDDFFDDAPETR